MSTLLASSSWDSAVRIHDTSAANAALVTQKQMDCGPLLCLATASVDVPAATSVPSTEARKNTGAVVYTGGLDGSVRKFDVDANEVSLVGYHGSATGTDGGGASFNDKHAVSCICAISNIGSGNVIVSASWDGTFHLWDLRGSNGSRGSRGTTPVETLKLPGKAFAMDVATSNLGTDVVGRIVVATSGRRTCVIDIEIDSSDPSAPLRAVQRLERESSLKYQTRVVKFFHDGTGMALGSIEGRVAIEYLDELQLDSGGKKKYAFKCHRVGDTVYPVNSIAFHPILGTFATGGCDGTVVMWDGRNKKKLTTLPKFPTSVAAMTFNADGTELAIASSYTFEEGEREHPRDEIFVREMLDYEIKPKSK